MECSFISAPFRAAAKVSGVVIQASRSEGHNALSVRGRYNAPLRCFSAIRTDDSSRPSPYALRLAVQVIKDTTGPDGLVANLVAFGLLTWFPGHDLKPTPVERAIIVATALPDAAQASSETLVILALRSEVLPATRMLIRPQDKVRVCRECSRQWD